MFSKIKLFKKIIYYAVQILFIGTIIFFWIGVASKESSISESVWFEDHYAAWLYLITYYLKALVKTVMLSSIVIVLWPYIKKLNKDA